MPSPSQQPDAVPRQVVYIGDPTTGNPVSPGGASATAVTPVNRSVALPTANASAVMAPANASRRGLWLQAPDTADIWVNDMGGAATTASPSLKVSAGTLYEWPAHMVPSTAVSVICATAGVTVTAREY